MTLNDPIHLHLISLSTSALRVATLSSVSLADMAAFPSASCEVVFRVSFDLPTIDSQTVGLGD